MLSDNIAVAESTKAHTHESGHIKQTVLPQAKKFAMKQHHDPPREPESGGWIRATTFEGTLQGGLEGSVPGGGARRWEGLEAPLKPFSSPLEVLLKPPWSPSQAPFKPPWSPLQALLKPPWSPLEALLKPPWSPLQASHLQAPLKPFSSPLEALLKPPWSHLERVSSPASLLQALLKPPVQPPGNPSKPFPKGSFM